MPVRFIRVPNARGECRLEPGADATYLNRVVDDIECLRLTHRDQFVLVELQHRRLGTPSSIGPGSIPPE